MEGKKLFKATVTCDNGEQKEYFRRAHSEREAWRIVKKFHNYAHDKEPWAYVQMVLEELSR